MKSFSSRSIAKISTYFRLRIAIWLLPAISFGIILAVYPQLPDKLPLYYSLPWGEVQLANRLMITLLPGIMLIINAVDMLAVKLVQLWSDSYLVSVMLYTNFICNLFLFIALIEIIRIIT